MHLVFYHSSGHWSASSRVFAAAARGLAQRGHDVIIVGCQGGTAVAGFEGTGLEVVALPIGESYGGDTWRLRALLRARAADAVFFHTEREHVVASAAMRLGT